MDRATFIEQDGLTKEYASSDHMSSTKIPLDGPEQHTIVQVPLKAALPFLEGALRAAAEKRRNSSIVKSLRRSENLQLREEVIRCRQRYGPLSLPQFIRQSLDNQCLASSFPRLVPQGHRAVLSWLQVHHSHI